MLWHKTWDNFKISSKCVFCIDLTFFFFPQNADGSCETTIHLFISAVSSQSTASQSLSSHFLAQIPSKMLVTHQRAPFWYFLIISQDMSLSKHTYFSPCQRHLFPCPVQIHFSELEASYVKNWAERLQHACSIPLSNCTSVCSLLLTLCSLCCVCF